MRSDQDMMSNLHCRTGRGALRLPVKVGLAGWVCVALWFVVASGGWVDAPPADGRLAAATSQQNSQERPNRVKAIRALPLFLTVSGILVLVVLVGSYAFARALRRHGSLARRPPTPPTPTNDVWATHKVPQEESSDDDEEEEEEEEEEP